MTAMIGEKCKKCGYTVVVGMLGLEHYSRPPDSYDHKPVLRR